jgi:hypothetical protein
MNSLRQPKKPRIKKASRILERTAVCPTLPQILKFAQIGNDYRHSDMIVAHMRTCASCYELWVDCRLDIIDERKVENVKKIVPAGVSIIVILGLIGIVSLQHPKIEHTSTTLASAGLTASQEHMLATASTLAATSPLLSVPEGILVETPVQILHPAGEYVLSRSPRFSWRATGGFTAQRLLLQGSGISEESYNVSGSSTVAPNLAPGTFYQWKIIGTSGGVTIYSNTATFYIPPQSVLDAATVDQNTLSPVQRILLLTEEGRYREADAVCEDLLHDPAQQTNVEQLTRLHESLLLVENK